MVTIVKIARILGNDSQQDLADFLGCTRSSLSLKENGKVKFTLDEVKALSQKYKISIDALVNIESTKEKIIQTLQS